MWINIVVALSNVYGLQIFETNISFYHKLIYLLTIIFSSLMHLSERKHKLNGVKYFNKYSNLFLWLDRIFAYIATILVLIELYYNINKLYNILNYAIIGLVSLFISENIAKSKLIFMIFHIIWHIMAYHIIYLVHL